MTKFLLVVFCQFVEDFLFVRHVEAYGCECFAVDFELVFSRPRILSSLLVLDKLGVSQIWVSIVDCLDGYVEVVLQ